MPLYDSICEECSTVFSEYRSVSRYKDTPQCCGAVTKLVITAPMLQASTFRVFDAFESPSTGRVISSKKERDADMKSSGCREWEGLAVEKQEAARIKQYEEEKADKQLENTIKESIRKLPEKERLAITVGE